MDFSCNAQPPGGLTFSMVSLPHLLAFSLASVALIALPGPTVLFVIGRSLALGRRGGILSVAGNALGLIPVILAVALGLGAIVAQSVVVFTIIKFAGAAYIVYLGIQAIRHRRSAMGASGVSLAHKSRRRLLAEGFVVGVSNPKSLVFFVAVLPQFVDYGAGSVVLQLLTLGLVFVVLAFIGDSTWLSRPARPATGSRSPPSVSKVCRQRAAP